MTRWIRARKVYTVPLGASLDLDSLADPSAGVDEGPAAEDGTFGEGLSLALAGSLICLRP